MMEWKSDGGKKGWKEERKEDEQKNTAENRSTVMASAAAWMADNDNDDAIDVVCD